MAEDIRVGPEEGRQSLGGYVSARDWGLLSGAIHILSLNVPMKHLEACVSNALKTRDE